MGLTNLFLAVIAYNVFQLRGYSSLTSLLFTALIPMMWFYLNQLDK